MPSPEELTDPMHAPFIDFVKRFRALERENAAQDASSPQDAVALYAYAATTRARPVTRITPPDSDPVSQ